MNKELENFCKICLSKVEIGKKFKKTDMCTLIELLDPTIPKKTLDGYKKNNAGWKEGNLLYHFNKILFPLFLSCLQVNAGSLNPTEGEISERFDYRYLDYSLQGTVDELKDLRKEVENLQEDKGYVSQHDYFSMMQGRDEQIKMLQENNETLERKIKDQREYFQKKMDVSDERHKSHVGNLTDELHKSYKLTD